jgi:small-conductance mechanosensitive channel
MNLVFFNNSSSTWLLALSVGVAVTLGLYALKAVLVRRLGAWAARTETRADDIAIAALDATHFLVLAIIGVYAGALVLHLEPGVDLLLGRAATTAGLVQAAIWGDSALRGWLAQYRGGANEDPGRATSAAAIGFISRVALWAVLALMVLDNLGFNITTLVASLGIGGIAVALAVQNILGDLFASLSIVLDKPFVIGDVINVSGVAGTVEYVGLKTTRVRSVNGEQIIFSNADLLKSRIHNMKRMDSRRVALTIGVTYDTSEPELRAIPPLVAAIVKAQPQVSFDRAHFSGLGPSSMNFEVVYTVNTPDYAVHMDVQQEVLLQLVKCFAERGIEFAFPTQTLHLVDANAGRAARAEAAGSLALARGAGRAPDSVAPALVTEAGDSLQR